MKTFYHFTYKRNLSKVLLEGLKPASITGNRNTYLGVQGDPNYIYLWCEEVMKIIGILATLGINPEATIRNSVLLKVIIDDRLAERDYDQLLYLFKRARVGNKYFRSLKQKAKALGTEIKDFSKQGIRTAIDVIPEDLWKKKPGSYRTSKTIANVILITWNDVVPLWLRILGFFTRPMIWLVVKLYKFLTKEK